MIFEPRRALRREGGIALVSVLLLLVFVLTLVAGLFYRHQIHIHKVTRAVSGDQALLLVLGAETWVASVLEADARAGKVDHLGEAWARPLPPMPVEGGEISGCLRDMAGLFNLNNLGAYTNKRWEDELRAETAQHGVATPRAWFREILRQRGLDAGDRRIAALVDWVDPDAWLVTPESAEDNEYLLLDPPYRPANHPLTELGELPLVIGFDAADGAALAPWVSTLPRQTRLNVNTAPAPVLAALSPLIAPARVEALLARRPFTSLGAFYDALAAVAGESRDDLLQRIPADLLAVGSDYFALRARVSLAGLRYDYESLIHRPASGRARVIARTFAPVPRLAQDAGGDAAIGHPCNHNEVISP